MEKKIKFQITLLLLIVFLISAVSGAIFGFMAGTSGDFLFSKIFKQEVKSEGEDKKISEQAIALGGDLTVVEVVEKSSPSVVSIVVTKDIPKVKNFFNNPFFDNFFSPFSAEGDNSEMEKRKIGGGSGFIISKDGRIITNKHVVNDKQADYTVITNDGTEYQAKILALHPSLDVAFLKIEGENFQALELGDSNSLKVGQSVVAIGNPLGEFANSASSGIVSGLKRDITASSVFGEMEKLTGIIQTDAAINPGNSGGPLLDLGGKVIGVNVAVAQGAENIGFALPINEVKKTLEQVQSQGKISVPFLGVRYIILDKEIQKENNLPYDYGALVLRGETITDFAVVPGSPADKAGILENDIILEMNGEKITLGNQLGKVIAEHNVGDEVTLKVWSKGEEREIKVKLEENK